jgi:hypothetical protein
MIRRIVAPGLLLAARLAAGQEAPPAEQFFEPAPPASAFEFRWDALVRYDAIDLSRQDFYRPDGTYVEFGDIHRWRTEARPELDWKASDRFKIGVRGLGELSSDSNATNDARFDNYRSNNASLDRFFVEAKPGSFTFWAGQFDMPLRSTEMLWDRDIQVLGGAGSWRIPLGGPSAVTLASGFFYGPQREHDQSHIAAGQATLSLGSPDGFQVDLSEAYWRFTHLQNTQKHFLRQNNPVSPTVKAYEYDFRIVDSLVRLKVPLGRFPIAFSVDWAHNFAVDEAKYRDGVEVALRVGQEGNPGDVQIFDVYQYVDRDAVVGAYNTDDWWFHSWYVGHRVGVAVTILPQVMVRPSVVFQRRQDREHYLNRYLVDLVKTF